MRTVYNVLHAQFPAHTAIARWRYCAPPRKVAHHVLDPSRLVSNASMADAAPLPAVAVLAGRGDAYDGVLVDAGSLPESREEFAERLHHSLQARQARTSLSADT